MAKIDNGSVCLNHPNVPAVARCAVCRKPICADCVVKKDGVTYCSAKCRDDAIRTGAMVEGVQESKKRSSSNRMIMTLIKLIILLALVAGGWFAYNKMKDDPEGKKLLKNVTKEVKKAGQKVEQTVDQGKQAVKEKGDGLIKDSKYKKEREALVK